MSANKVETRIEMPELDELRGCGGDTGKRTIMDITTDKAYEGGSVKTTVSVATVNGPFISFALGRDLMVVVKRKEAKRVTKKAIQTQHDSITAGDVDLYREMAMNHYRAEAARREMRDAA